MVRHAVLILGLLVGVQGCTFPLKGTTDLVFVADHSSNLCSGVDLFGCVLRWEDTIDMMIWTVRQFDMDAVRVGLVTYEDVPTIRWQVDRYQENKLGLVDALEQQKLTIPSGNASLADAIVTMKDMIKDTLSDNMVAIVLTGGDSMDNARAKAEAEAAHALDIDVFAVGVMDAPVELLKNISSPPQTAGKTYLYQANYPNLIKVPYHMLQEACLPLDAKVQPPLDVVFVLDGSISVCTGDPTWNHTANWCSHWQAMKDLTRDVIDVLDVDSGAVNVGLVITHQVDAEVQWQLDTYSDRMSLKNAVEAIEFPASMSSLPLALGLMRTEIFKKSDGDRVDVENLAFILAEGDADPDETFPDEALFMHESAIRAYPIAINATGNITYDEFVGMASLPKIENQNYFVCDWMTLDDARMRLIAAGGFVSTATTTAATTTTMAPHPTPPPYCVFELRRSVDIVFLVDHSQNVCNTGTSCSENFGHVVDTMTSIMKFLKVGPNDARMALVLYEDNGQVFFPLTNADQESLVAAFDSVRILPPGDNSNLADGIRDVRDGVFASSAAPEKLAILIISGDPNVEVENVADEVTQTQEAGIVMYAIGVTDQVSDATLRAISSPPSEEYLTWYHADDHPGLDAVPYFFLSAICMDIDTHLEPPLDMVFVLDGSLSVCDEDPTYNPEACPACTCKQWEDMKEFVVHTVEELDLAADRIRVGLVTSYQIGAKIEFLLDTYSTKAEVIAAVEAVYFPDGLTNIPAMLNTMRTQVFTELGDRSDADNVAIIVLDGESHPNYPATEEIFALQTSNIRSFVIGVSGTVSEETVRAISSLPQEWKRTYFGSTYGSLDYAREQMMDSGGFKNERTTCNWPLEGTTDLAFVLDQSDNVCIGTADVFECVLLWEDIIDMVIWKVKQLDLDRTRLALVQYRDGSSSVVWNFEDYNSRDDILSQLLSLKLTIPEGTANAADAFITVRNSVFTSANTKGRNKVVVYVAAGPTIDDDLAAAEAKNLNAMDVLIFSVGAGAAPEDLVRETSTPPQISGQTYIMEPVYSSLIKVPYYLLQQACLPLTARVSPPLDIVFVVDGSISVCARDPTWNRTTDTCSHWEEFKYFTNDVIDVLDIDSGAVHVGLVSTELLTAQVRWKLDAYTDKAALKAAVSAMGFPASVSSLPEAIGLMRTQVFGETGDRLDADNVAIILSESDPDPDFPYPDESRFMHEAGIRAYAVAAMGDISMEVLKGMASLPREEDKNWFVCWWDQTFPCVDKLLAAAGFQPEPVLTTTTPAVSTTMKPTPPPACIWDLTSGKTDVVFMVDHSLNLCNEDGSACGANWELVVDMMVSTVRRLSVGIGLGNAGLMLLKAQAAVMLPLLDGDKDGLVNAFRSVKVLPPSGTDLNIADGLRDVRTRMFASSTADHKLAIFIGAGEANLEPSEIATEADAAYTAGILVFSVGITSKISKNTLSTVSGPPQTEFQTYLHLDDFSRLPSVPYLMLSAACTKLDTRIDPPLDMVFVLDSSYSVCDEDPSYDPDTCPACTCDRWEAMKQFVIDMVELLDFSVSGVRIGLVTTRGLGGVVQFLLDTHSTKIEVQNAVRALNFPDGLTNLPEMLRLMRTRVFTMAGDREAAENVAIVVLDGDTDPTAPLGDEAYFLQTSYIRSFVVGVRGTVSDNTLREVASLPKETDRTLFTGDYTNLDSVLERLMASGGFREQVVVSTTTTSTTASTTSPSVSTSTTSTVSGSTTTTLSSSTTTTPIDSGSSTTTTTPPTTPMPTDEATPEPTQPENGAVTCTVSTVSSVLCLLLMILLV